MANEYIYDNGSVIVKWDRAISGDELCSVKLTPYEISAIYHTAESKESHTRDENTRGYLRHVTDAKRLNHPTPRSDPNEEVIRLRSSLRFLQSDILSHIKIGQITMDAESVVREIQAILEGAKSLLWYTVDKDSQITAVEKNIDYDSEDKENSPVSKLNCIIRNLKTGEERPISHEEFISAGTNLDLIPDSCKGQVRDDLRQD